MEFGWKQKLLEILWGRRRHVRYTETISCKLLFIVCLFVSFPHSRLLKFIVLQILTWNHCVHMRHAFTLIDIWCIFIGALINVHVQAHTHPLALYSEQLFFFAVLSSCSFCLHCLQLMLSHHQVSHYLFHRIYCKYLQAKRRVQISAEQKKFGSYNTRRN